MLYEYTFGKNFISYSPTIFFKMIYRSPIIPKTRSIKKNRSFGILNKFRRGVIIIKVNPITLLIKNRGYRRIFVQKSFIIKFVDLKKSHLLIII